MCGEGVEEKTKTDKECEKFSNIVSGVIDRQGIRVHFVFFTTIGVVKRINMVERKMEGRTDLSETTSKKGGARGGVRRGKREETATSRLIGKLERGAIGAAENGVGKKKIRWWRVEDRGKPGGVVGK